MEANPTRNVLGYVALNTCTILWGTQHAVMKGLVASSTLPSLINAIRFSTAAFVTPAARTLILCCCHESKPVLKDAARGHCGLLIGAAELGFWQTSGFTLQLIGLRWTSASRSAFLLYLNATFVPIIATILGERGIGIRTWACVIVAVVGTLMLVHDGGEPNVGDLWSLGAALASAMFIVRLSRAGRGRNAVHLSAATLMFSALGCWALAFASANSAGLSLEVEVLALVEAHIWSLVYLSVVVSACASFFAGLRPARGTTPRGCRDLHARPRVRSSLRVATTWRGAPSTRVDRRRPRRHRESAP